MSGFITILKPKEEKIILTEDEYILYLLKLRRYNETHLLQICLKNSNNIFHKYTDPSLILWLRNKISLSDNITQMFEEKEELINELKSINQIKAEEYLNYSNVSVEEYLDRVKITKLITSTKIEHHYVIPVYENFLTLGTGSYFGESSFSNTQRKRYIFNIKETRQSLSIRILI